MKFSKLKRILLLSLLIWFTLNIIIVLVSPFWFFEVYVTLLKFFTFFVIVMIFFGSFWTWRKLKQGWYKQSKKEREKNYRLFWRWGAEWKEGKNVNNDKQK
jgi:hypothetical protein